MSVARSDNGHSQPKAPPLELRQVRPISDLESYRAAVRGAGHLVAIGKIPPGDAARDMRGIAEANGILIELGEDGVTNLIAEEFAAADNDLDLSVVWSAAEAKTAGRTRVDGAADWWIEGAVTAAQLQRMTFEPLRFVVPELVPEGVALLAGKPKVGKSWMMLDLAIAVTSDRFTLGEIKRAQGDVLYLALEDGKRRLQRRFTKLLPSFGKEWPNRLTIKTEWKRVDEGGIEGIAAWAKSVERPTLVIVDTLEKIRPKPPRYGKATPYSLDYHALEGLQVFASERGVTIIVTTHVRKADADDIFDTISGTLGLAVADTILVLGQRSGNPVLCVRGRDVEDVEKAVKFERGTCKWIILGEAADVQRSDSRAKILMVLREASEPMRPADIRVATDLTRDNVDKLLFRLAEDGEIIKISRGLYIHFDRQDLMPPIGRQKRQMSETGYLGSSNLTSDTSDNLPEPHNAAEEIIADKCVPPR
jgi:hypothetical protein